MFKPSNPSFIQAKVSVGEDEYTEHITSFEFVPTAPSASVTDIGGKTHKRTGKASYVCNLGLIQDWTSTGLAKFMHDHEGDEADISIELEEGTWDAIVFLKAPNIGGASGAIGQSTLALDVDGKPEFTPAAP